MCCFSLSLHLSLNYKERSGREGMTVVSVLLGAAVEVGVGSKKKSNKKAMNRNWGNQKANAALKTKAGNK